MTKKTNRLDSKRCHPIVLLAITISNLNLDLPVLPLLDCAKASHSSFQPNYTIPIIHNLQGDVFI